MDIAMILTCMGTGATVVGLIYAIMRNFKIDVNGRIDRLERRMDLLDDRMFLLSTGKTIAQAILEEKMKQEKK